jgi:hypothetical protein
VFVTASAREAPAASRDGFGEGQLDASLRTVVDRIGDELFTVVNGVLSDNSIDAALA